MGASDSQPTEIPRVESNEIEQRKDDIYPISFHEKHEEVTYDECNLETKKESALLPSDIFEIVACHPQYFRFVNDIIRQAIREQSKIDTQKNQKEYIDNFSSSDKMENSRNKILEHFKLKSLNQQYLKNNENMPIQIDFESNPELNNQNDPIINFQGILAIMKNQWAINNKKTIESFISNIQILSFEKKKLDMKSIRLALSKIMGKKYFDAFVPENLDFNYIKNEMNSLMQKLAQPQQICCMSFSKTDPINKITINGKILRHGICSNGNFLFILTKERVLSIYLIYDGSIDKLKRKYVLDQSWVFDSKTTLFCSQKNLYLLNNKQLFQWPICNIDKKVNINFKKSNNKEFEHISIACSNGVSYSIINDDKKIRTYSADNEYCIFEKKNEKVANLLNYVENNGLILTNGYYFGLIDNSGQVKILSPFFSDPIIFNQDDSFLRENDKPIEAATLDSISNSYFSVSYEKSNSIVYSYCYSGAPDITMLKLKNVNSKNIGALLLNALNSYAFSPIVPFNFISEKDDAIKKIYSLFLYIEKNEDEDANFVNAILILIDMNLRCHNCQSLVKQIFPILENLIKIDKYKMIASSVLVNNIDLFYDNFDLNFLNLLNNDIFLHSKVENQIFNDWILKKISQSSILGELKIDDNLLKSLFSEDWYCKSRKDDECKWMVDLLLISQQKLIENSIKILEKDPMNLSDSKSITLLCSHAQFIIDKLYNLLIQIKLETPIKNKRRINHNTILFTLISNFIVSAAPVTHCCQLATIFTNEKGRMIIQILINDFIPDEKLLVFIGYFDMIFTTSISELIRGGPIYSCEIEYEWLIKNNFYKGIRNLIPPDLSAIIDFLSINTDDFIKNFIKNESEDINHLYQKIIQFRPIKNEYFQFDRIIMAAIFHQTNTFNLLYEAKEQNKICNELKLIAKYVKKIRNRFHQEKQNEVAKNINENKQTDKILANLSQLIILNSSLKDYKERDYIIQEEYLNLLYKFIINNDPFSFQQVLKIIPKRIDHVISAFDRMLSLFGLFELAEKKTLQRIIIDGISRVDSFQRLGYLLSNAELNESVLSELTSFCIICVDMVVDIHQFTILEILYAIFETCHSTNEIAIQVMNKLISLIPKNNFKLDAIFITVAGLAKSTCVLPNDFDKLPIIGRSYIMQIIYGQRDKETLTIEDINNSICDHLKFVFNEVWITAMFTLIGKCYFDNSESVYEILDFLFQNSSDYISSKDFDFSLFSSIVYGFRYILNLENEVAEILQGILLSITLESSFNDIFLLFAIIGGDISEYSNVYKFRNQKGNWLKYSKNNNNYYMPNPISSLNDFHNFNEDEINQTIQEIELNLKMSLPFESIINFQNICMENQTSELCRFYLQTFARYISYIDQKIPIELIKSVSKNSKPFINFRNRSKYLMYLLKNSNKSFKSIKSILPEQDFGLGYIQQNKWFHIYAFNIMKFGPKLIKTIFLIDGFIIIHNQDCILIDTKNKTIGETNDMVDAENGEFEIKIDRDEMRIKINNQSFKVENSSYIEFVIDSIEDIVIYYDEKPNFNNYDILVNKLDNANVEYLNDLFTKENNSMDSFEDNFYNVKPLQINRIDPDINERNGLNIFYDPLIENIKFDKNLPFFATPSIYNRIMKTNEMEICNQLKSYILAQAVIKDSNSLDLATCLFVIKSAVVTVVEFDKNKLMKGEFPFSLKEGFFHNCSLSALQNQYNQVFLIAIKSLVKSQEFLDNLGNQLVLMASDRNYHSLIYKKDLVIINSDQIISYNKHKNDYFIEFSDGLIGKINIDESNNWMIDTPMVFLLLLWIYIEHCFTSQQRILAKLALINCYLIKSPMIHKFMPEFLSYIQKQMIFTPDDFNPTYIYHLSSLAKKNSSNMQIISFYEFERDCFRSKQIKNSLEIKDKNVNEFEKRDLNLYKSKNMNSSKMIEILQLMKKYDSIEQFPIWYFIPIWREISSYSINIYTQKICYTKENNSFKLFNQIDKSILFTFHVFNVSKCSFNIYNNKNLTNGKEIDYEYFKNSYMCYYIIKPGEIKYLVCNYNRKPKIDILQYQIEHKNQVTKENLELDAKKFAVDWNGSDTEELLICDINFYLQCKSFMWIFLDTLNMKKLINKYGLRTVQCKAACLFLIDSMRNHLNENDNEISRLARENSQYLSYYFRINNFTTEQLHAGQRVISVLNFYTNNSKYIFLNDNSAIKYLNGESNNKNDSMIYQISNKIKQHPIERFQKRILDIKFNGKAAIDVNGVTNQTITFAIISFILSKSGLCIKSPNFTDDEENDELTDIKVIPYPLKDDTKSRDALYAFGVILGVIIRNKITQDIPFPLFIWNYLAGKSITKEDVYENDRHLKDEIDGMKNGSITNHHWVYRDWNNQIIKISSFSEEQIVPQHLVDCYEKLVIEFRIKSIEKYLKLIRKGLYENQNIQDPSLLSGGLIMFMCQGEKTINKQEIINKIVFRGGTKRLEDNFKQVLNEYDEIMMKKFLMFVTSCPKPPNLILVPDFRIEVDFNNSIEFDKLPHAHTCFQKIDLPHYQTIDIMRQKIKYAIDNCITLDNS